MGKRWPHLSHAHREPLSPLHPARRSLAQARPISSPRPRHERPGDYASAPLRRTSQKRQQPQAQPRRFASPQATPPQARFSLAGRRSHRRLRRFPQRPRARPDERFDFHSHSHRALLSHQHPFSLRRLRFQSRATSVPPNEKFSKLAPACAWNFSPGATPLWSRICSA